MSRDSWIETPFFFEPAIALTKLPSIRASEVFMLRASDTKREGDFGASKLRADVFGEMRSARGGAI